MTTSASGPTRIRWTRLLTVLLCVVAAFYTPATAAAASRRHAVAYAAKTQPRALMSAAHAARADDRALVRDAKGLKRCLQAHPGHCASLRKALQAAGTRLSRAEHHLSHVAGTTAAKGSAAASHGPYWFVREAPKLGVSGESLDWSSVGGVGTYVLASKVPGEATKYTVIDGTSVTPPPVPGLTVGYSVRTTAAFSSWSAEVQISYPKAPESSEPVKTPTDQQSAPALTASGTTLSWNAVEGVSAYVLATKAPGAATQYTEVSGTSTTPPAVPGETVSYSVRTAVEGSAWSPEVSISYPAQSKEATSPPSTAEEPVEERSGSPSGPFEMGVVAGTATTELPYIQTVGARTVRMEIGINYTAAEISGLVEYYAEHGVRLLLLAGFPSRIPSSAEAQNLAGWAAAFGPGGTLWKGKSMPAGTAVTDIEFGNETSYTYQFSNNSTSVYDQRAREYAIRFKEAAEAIKAANPSVGLLAQADSGGNGPGWVQNMFAAVPNLGQLAAGWTVHPYGAAWQSRLEEAATQTIAAGAPASVPIYITEWGLSSDNGRCLTNNFGWNPCMTYAEAATTLTSTIAQMRARYGTRLAALYLYHVRDQKPTGSSTEREAYFGAVQSNDQPKGAYTAAVQSLIAANP